MSALQLARGIVGAGGPTIPEARSEQVHLVGAGAADAGGPLAAQEPVGGDQDVEVAGVIVTRVLRPRPASPSTKAAISVEAPPAAGLGTPINRGPETVRCWNQRLARWRQGTERAAKTRLALDLMRLMSPIIQNLETLFLL